MNAKKLFITTLIVFFALINGILFSKDLVLEVWKNRPTYLAAFNNPSDACSILRSTPANARKAYHYFLSDLERRIPANETMTILTSRALPIIWKEYFEAIGRYHLYPRYFGENGMNKDHLLLIELDPKVEVRGFESCLQTPNFRLLSRPGKCYFKNMTL